MTNEVEKARAVQSGLEGKRVAALKSLAEVDDVRATLAFDAHVSGGEPAKRLKALDAERVRIAADIESLNSALSEAGRRIATAQEAARREDERRRKKEALPLVKRQKELGRSIAAGLLAARECLREFKQNMSELALLGAPVAGGALVEVNLTRALDSALAGLHPKARPVAPTDRHEFSELADSWMISVEGWARNDERAAPTSAPAPVKAEVAVKAEAA